MILDGQAAIFGFSVSLTVTVKLAVLVVPLLSAASHLTVVVPFAKVDPVAGLQENVASPEQSSSAVAVKVTTAVHLAGSVD